MDTPVQPEVVTERQGPVWVTVVVGGKFDGLAWRSPDERTAVDRHVALIALLRAWEDVCLRDASSH